MADATGRPVEIISVYKTVNEMVLHSFTFDDERLEAKFHVRFDGAECPHDFMVGFDSEGTAHAVIEKYPYAHTELCDLVEMPQPAFDALTRAVRGIFTAIKPLPKKDGRFYLCPVGERMPDAGYLSRLPRDPKFTLTVKV